MPLVSFYAPLKHPKTIDFLIFSGGIERDQWHEMGQVLNMRSLKVTQSLFKVV